MLASPSMRPQAEDYVRWKLGAHPSARDERGLEVAGLTFDYLVLDDDVFYVVEIRSRPTVDTIARLAMARELLRGKEELRGREIVLVLAAEELPNVLLKSIGDLDIQTINLPRGMSPSSSAGRRHVKITSDRSWKAVSQLLRLHPSSIKQIADDSGVSYGWAHATVNELISRNVVRRPEGSRLLEIGDADGLLNGVAWERPTLSLMKAEFPAASDSVYALARAISSFAADNGISVAFACYLPAGLFTGYAMRHDALQLYAEPGSMELIERAFRSEGGNINVQMLAPDRDVLGEAVTREDIPITSPSQTLLDMAGLGRRGRDLTLKLLEALDARL